MINRLIWIILDSVGVGDLPDAHLFGDEGSNTLSHTVMKTGIKLPHLAQLGLGEIDTVEGIVAESPIEGVYGKCAEISNGKDTTIGHWEMAGIYSKEAFPTFPQGFPEHIIREFEEKTGRRVMGNKPASGTDILDELAEEQMKTGNWIVYTSADSVFQIAAHEEIIPLDELYKACEIARAMLQDEYAVARVIARPYLGAPKAFERTSNRRDYSLSPGETILDIMKEASYDVIAVGKIEDIFNGKGITEAVHTKDNMDGVDVTLDYMKKDNKGIIFTNLVEFDSKWGHRNDVEGYANGLVEFDKRLPEILAEMKESDVLFINADHGCDPTTESTDHSREYIPFLAYGQGLKKNVNIGTRRSFADIAQTISEMFGVNPVAVGESFYQSIKVD